ncbi:hypothetical protein KY330_02520 [Candidatus Woesearchaeota archaeon]|nr:hypothetical protein [Candidatus Woesearchaeota archaeon]
MKDFKHVMFHLNKATDDVVKRRHAKTQLTEKFERIKKAARDSPESLTDELEELEMMLREVLNMERELVQQQKKYNEVLKKALDGIKPGTDVVRTIEDIKKKLYEASQFENLHAVEYRNKLEDLEYKFAELEKQEIEQLTRATDEIKRVHRDISELRERVDTVSFKPMDRKRLDELERRIREDVQKNRKELLIIEQEIRQLERKSKKLKETGDVDKKVIEKVEKKIGDLKEKASVMKHKFPSSTEPLKKAEKKEMPELKLPKVKSKIQVSERAGEREASSGISEIKIAPMPKFTEEEKVEEKPKQVQQTPQQAIEGLMPVAEGEQELEEERPLVEDFKPEQIQEKYEPDLRISKGMPPEFEQPKKKGAWSRFKEWLGIKKKEKV